MVAKRKHSPEYSAYILSPQWREKSKFCLWLSGNKCVLTWGKATHTHHLSYDNFKHEWLLRDTVPLSPAAHRFIHSPLLWDTQLRVLVNYLLRFLYVVKILFRWI